MTDWVFVGLSRRLEQGACLLIRSFWTAGLLAAATAQGQTVSMSGEFGISSGRIVNLPLNPPVASCVQAQNARCVQGSLDPGSGVELDPLVEPSGGVGVAGAGEMLISGGLSLGDPFEIPPGAFYQDAGPQFTPFVNHPSLVQMNTTLSFSMPAAARAVNPPAATRVFRENAWSAPGNGQTGRAAALTTPISAGTQTVHAITLRYRPGLNAFGGTMAMLQDGEGALFVRSITPLGSSPPATSRPYVAKFSIGDGVTDNPETRYGAGWNYTHMGSQSPSIIKNFVGLAPPCTVATPPGPPGCGLVTDFSGTTIGTIPAATSTRHLFAWTTGTVEVLRTGTLGGLPVDQLLTAMGYDSTSMTGAGGTIRNIGLVAGAYTLRTAPSSPTNSGHQVVGLNLRFTPEPAGAAALVTGLAALGLLGRRKS